MSAKGSTTADRLEAEARKRVAPLDATNKALERQIEKHKRDKEALRRSERTLRDLSKEFLRAEEQEKKLIASELHGRIGATLSAIKFGVEVSLHSLELKASGASADLMRGVVAKIRDAIEDVRKIDVNLSPSTLDDLGILPTIDWLSREFHSAHPQIEIIKRLDLTEIEIPHALKIVVYRIIRDALDNVVKDASTSEVCVELAAASDQIILCISANGRSPELTTCSHQKDDDQRIGLQRIRYRADLSGGRFSMQSTPSTGTVVKVSWAVPIGSDAYGSGDVRGRPHTNSVRTV